MNKTLTARYSAVLLICAFCVNCGYKGTLIPPDGAPDRENIAPKFHHPQTSDTQNQPSYPSPMQRFRHHE